MNDNPSHELLQDPMFEAMLAVMEESEKKQEAVADFEKSVDERFKHCRHLWLSTVNDRPKKNRPENGKNKF